MAMVSEYGSATVWTVTGVSLYSKDEVMRPVQRSSVWVFDVRSSSEMSSANEKPRVPRLRRWGFSRSQLERSGWSSLGWL